MRLDNDCIRDIMLYIEDSTPNIKSKVNVRTMIEKSKYNSETIYYHLEKISQANLIQPLHGKKDHFISSLTWEGHQYLDNIRDDKIWKIVKEKASIVASLSLKILIPLAESVIKQKLGLS